MNMLSNKNIIEKVILVALMFVSIDALKAQDCYESTIVSPTPFAGNKKDNFKLSDGSIWVVTDFYAQLSAQEPNVTICPDQGELIIEDKAIKVRLLALPNKPSEKKKLVPLSNWEMYEETNLKGTISGKMEKERVLKTVSGNIYEIVGYTFQFVVKHEPEVTILRHDDIYKLIVNGFDEPLICRKIN